MREPRHISVGRLVIPDVPPPKRDYGKPEQLHCQPWAQDEYPGRREARRQVREDISIEASDPVSLFRVGAEQRLADHIDGDGQQYRPDRNEDSGDDQFPPQPHRCPAGLRIAFGSVVVTAGHECWLLA